MIPILEQENKLRPQGSRRGLNEKEFFVAFSRNAKIRASHSRLSQSCRWTALSSLGADGRKYDLMKRADLNDLGQYDCVVMVTDHSDYDSPASFVPLLQNASTTTPETSNRPESFLPRRTREDESE